MSDEPNLCEKCGKSHEFSIDINYGHPPERYVCFDCFEEIKEQELAAANTENTRLIKLLEKYGICSTCGYMCSDDGEFHTCKKEGE